MKKHRVKTIIILLLLLPMLSIAMNQKFTEGKQYKQASITSSSSERFQVSENKVLVVEFFNYGCPWCFHLESSLEPWLKGKPKYVQFKRVPVVFERGWEAYAKAYYTAEALGELEKITPKLFDAIHNKGLNLASDSAIEKFFVAQGISQPDFESAYNFSPSIGLELQRAKGLMLAYKIFEIPTFVIDGKYITNARMTNGNNEELIDVVNYLVEKEKAAKKL